MTLGGGKGLSVLQGIKVVEMGQNLAAPYAASILADLGAEVVKVEKPGGDDARGWGPPFVAGSSTSFHLMNRNKQSVVLSIDQEQDRALFLDLIRNADIFVHNLRPGVPEKLEISADDLRAINPRLIYCEQTAFGNAGPMAGKPGYEPLLQAFSGLISINGDPEGPASRVGASVVDLGTGMWSVIGALAALLERQRTGQGGVVTTSLFETAMGWTARHIADYGATGTIPPRVGTGHNSLTPYQAFQSKDGPLVITAGNDRLFAKLAAVLGEPQWVEDPRFLTNSARTQNRSVLLPLIEEKIVQKGFGYWMQVLEAAGVPCAPIHSIPQVVEHPQTLAMDLLLDAQDEKLKLVRLPLALNGAHSDLRGIAPELNSGPGRFSDGAREG
ncbi:CaiB/BaiF CoA transferase family protein [Devosia sp. A449]